MSPSNGGAAPSSDKGKSSLGAFLWKLRKRRIIETLAAFIGGGWLLLEFVHWILVDHYHFPEKIIDITFVTILGALLCTLIWRWFSGREKPRKLKPELFLVPLVLLITLGLDLNLLVHLKEPESETFPAAKWRNTIAVLPFIDMSPQKDQEYFCDGLTEELINRLSNVRELRVPARTSTFFFKGKEQDIREIGRKLDVNTVLEGSVRRAGNELRITAQLINIADGYHLWSQTYDRELQDIFAIQDEIALAIADRLEISLLSGEKGRMTKHPTENKEAYDLYLKGRYFWYQRTSEGFAKSLEYYQKALEKDPSYALAYVGIADTYLQMGWYDVISSDLTRQKARPFIEKALHIDDHLAAAHSSAAILLGDFEFDFDGAEKEYRKALALDPGYFHAHHWYSLFLSSQGRYTEAIQEIQKALSLDPLSLLAHTASGGIYYDSGQYDLAIEALKKPLELAPNFYVPRIWLALVYAQKQMYADAIRELERAEEQTLGKSTLVTAFRGRIYAVSGKKEEAEAIINNLVQKSKEIYVSPWMIAVAFAELGKVHEASEWLESAVQTKDHWLVYAKTGPMFDILRKIPRAQELLKKIRFR